MRCTICQGYGPGVLVYTSLTNGTAHEACCDRMYVRLEEFDANPAEWSGILAGHIETALAKKSRE